MLDHIATYGDTFEGSTTVRVEPSEPRLPEFVDLPVRYVVWPFKPSRTTTREHIPSERAYATYVVERKPGCLSTEDYTYVLRAYDDIIEQECLADAQEKEQQARTDSQMLHCSDL